MEKEIHTRIHPDGGIETYELDVEKPKLRRTIINPPNANPFKPRIRFDLPGWALGKLEVLAQSRFEIAEASGKTQAEIGTLDFDDPDTILSIYQTVHASSRVENEGVDASEVPVVYNAITKPLGQRTKELSQRQAAEKDIWFAYRWALKDMRDQRPIVSTSFILELHRRMFEGSKGDLAGRFKDEPVIIADDDREFYDVTTLPPEKAKLFLDALCERTNKAFDAVDRYAQHSKILLIAEFLVDFLAIHPFRDGNGRTARLLSTYLLERSGYHFVHTYPIDQVVLDSRAEYFEALFKAQQNWYTDNEDLSPWFEYYINAVFRQWERAFAVIRDKAMKKRSQPSKY